MASASPKAWGEIKEDLLTCKVCEEPFNQQDRLPRVLPCQHCFCGPCLTKMNKGGELSCPNCRQKIQVAGTFPVDITRSALLDCKEVLQTAQEAQCEGCDDGGQASSRCLDCSQALCENCLAVHRRLKATQDHAIVSLQEAAASPSLLLPKVEKCQKHQDEKLKFYCKTCKSAICSTCVIILHKDRDGHDVIELDDMMEQIKRQIESHCGGIDNILDSILQPRAKMAATSLQETDASFKAAEQQIEDVFSKAVNALLERKAQALEDLRSIWKADRLQMEDQAADTESKVSSTKTSTALGRTVASVGLPSHVVAQEQELERVVQEARAEGEKPLQSPPRYKVTTDLSGIMKCIQELGAVNSVAAATSRSTGVPTTRPLTSSTTSVAEATSQSTGARKKRPQKSSTKSDVRQLSGPDLAARMTVGTRVKRGADWQDWRGDQDGRGLGTVTVELNRLRWIGVTWDNGYTGHYCMGRWGCYELQLA